ncbi:hypothetical protein EV1_043927 [Malus domestica]
MATSLSRDGHHALTSVGMWEAIVSAIQTAFRTPHMTPLEILHNLKLTHFMGNEGHEGAEKWLNHVEKTFQVM